MVLGALLATASPASAHVSVAGEVHAGGSGAFVFTVPNERDDATTTKLQVQLPEDVPLGSFRVQPKPGWTVETTTRTLDEPIEIYGREVTEVVDTVTWTAQGEGIGIDQFDTFTVRGGNFPEDVTEVAFPAIQTYSSGEEVAWIDEAVEGQEEPEHPAPVLELLPPEGEEDDAGDDAGDVEAAAATSPADADDDDDSGGALATVSLVVAVASLGVAAAALVTARKKPAAT
ncbi:MAG TPA: YcnI family protein [Acidimicrobiales bacterium]